MGGSQTCNLFSAYDGSLSLTYVKRCVEQFEQTNKVKYLLGLQRVCI